MSRRCRPDHAHCHDPAPARFPRKPARRARGPARHAQRRSCLATRVSKAATNCSFCARRPAAASTLKNLRRGHWVIQEQLDLHGLDVAEARALTCGVSRGMRTPRTALRADRPRQGPAFAEPRTGAEKKVAGWLIAARRSAGLLSGAAHRGWRRRGRGAAARREASPLEARSEVSPLGDEKPAHE